MLLIETVEEFFEELVASSKLELGTNRRVDLRGQALLFPLERGDQILIQGDGYLALG